MGEQMCDTDTASAHERWALISLDPSGATMWYLRGRKESLETYIALIPRLADLEPQEREEAEKAVDSLLSYDEVCDLGRLVGETQPDRDLHIIPYEGCRELHASLGKGQSYEVLKSEEGQFSICGVDFSPALASAMFSRMEVDCLIDVDDTR